MEHRARYVSVLGAQNGMPIHGGEHWPAEALTPARRGQSQQLVTTMAVSVRFGLDLPAGPAGLEPTFLTNAASSFYTACPERLTRACHRTRIGGEKCGYVLSFIFTGKTFASAELDSTKHCIGFLSFISASQPFWAMVGVSLQRSEENM